MATVHLGRLMGPVGFSRTVAIKRLHAQFASDPEFVSMFLDEARLAARIRHPNVVPTLDVVATGGELFLVMEYVPGESIARLSRALREKQQIIPLRILSAVMAGVLHGLHAAHEAKDERGHALGIVHRDMSPQNVLVGTDGVARVLDFGVAKAAGRMQTTREGQIKGKLSYMPPEQLRGGSVNRQSDIYAAGVMLWELVTGQRLFGGDNEGAIVAKVLEGNVEAPSRVLMRSISKTATLTDAMVRGIEDLDATILRALAMDPGSRFTTAREMAIEIERKLPPATGSEVADWVEHIAKEVLSSRAAMVAEIESSASLAAAEPVGGHVQSVLSAKATLNQHQLIMPDGRNPGRDGDEPPMSGIPTVTRQDAPPILPSQPGTSVARLSYTGPTDGPPVTQPSSISVATGASGRSNEVRGGGRRAIVAALVGVLLGASVLGSALFYRHTLKAQAAADTLSTWSSGATNGAAEATTAPTTGVTPTSAEATTDAGSAAASSDAASPLASATGVTPTTPKLPPPKGKQSGGNPSKPLPTATAAVAAAPDCTTPYWFDAQGVKHYKPQCFDK